MKMFIAPNFFADTDTFAPTLEVKIGLFERQVRGWTLNIAQELLKIPDSGFAVLAVVMSYPEKIWQYENGQSSRGKSPLAFREGMASIFSDISLNDPTHVAEVDRIYESVRCGMYHDAGTRAGVLLSEQFSRPFAISGKYVEVNPHLLPGVFGDHLGRYVAELVQPKNSLLRTNFERMFGKA